MEVKSKIPPRLNICMLLPDPYSPNMPARPGVTEIYGKCLPEMGHKVTWITPAKESLKEIQERTFGNVHIYVIPCYAGSSLVRKILAKPLFLWREVKIASKVIQEENCNIVQVRDEVVEGMLAIYLKRKHKIPFVFQYSFPTVEGGLEKYRLNSTRMAYLLARVRHFVRPFVMRHADLILPISKWMEEDLAKNGVAREKMFPVPMAVNADLFSPTIGGEQTRLKYNLTGSKAVIYQGVMDKLRHLDVLFYAFALVKRERANVRLLMVGDGDDKANLEKLARNLGLERDVIFTGQVPYLEVPQFIAVADIAMSPIPPLAIYKVSSPCKLFEYMGVAKPVVANEEIPEHREVLEQSGGGILVPFAPEAFAHAIIELLDNPQKAVEMGQRGREWVVKNRTYEILARQVEEKYFELLELLKS